MQNGQTELIFFAAKDAADMANWMKVIEEVGKKSVDKAAAAKKKTDDSAANNNNNMESKKDDMKKDDMKKR